MKTSRPNKRLLNSVLMGCLIVLSTWSTVVVAQTRYIGDELRVPLRTGPSGEHRIINAGIPSGAQITLLDTNEEGNWSFVRFNNQEGWIQTQFVVSQPIARDRLVTVQAELNSVRTQYNELRQQFNDLRDDRMAVDSLYQSLEQERDAALAEVARIRDVSGNAIQLDDRNRELVNRNRVLENENDQLRRMNEALEDTSSQWRMIAGGGLVLAGLLTGLLLPILMRRRRSDGWA